ncbi:MAG: ATP-binding protein [Anaerolineae bacterium]|nr:ATP-binding protein [Anaerolineae bacterium]
MMTRVKQRFWPLAELVLPWGLLIVLLYFSFALFAFRPYIGVLINQNKTITSVFGPYPKTGGVQPGDEIRSINSLTPEDLENDLRKSYFENVEPGQTVDILVDRQGTPVKIEYKLPDGITPEELFDRLNSQWFMPYIFWLAGTVVLFFLRPRSVQRLLLALFCYITAAWVSASNFSGVNFMNGSLLLRSEIWLSVPIYLHLHWSFPSPLRRLPKWVWASLDLFGIIMAFVSWQQWVPADFYMVGFIFALVGSLILLGAHLISQPEERRALAGLVWALGMVLLPVLVIVLLGVLNIAFPFPGIVVLGLAALPGFYFFTLYRRQLNPTQIRRAEQLVRIYMFAILSGLVFCVFFAMLAQSPLIYRYLNNLNIIAGIILIVIAVVNFLPFLVLPALGNEHITLDVGRGRLSFSANRTAAGVFFLLLDGMISLLALIFIRQLNFLGASELGVVVAVLIAGVIALMGYQPFKNFFDRFVLGISLAPESLIKTYSGKITTSLELDALQQLILEEVMPSLLVRQFAQLKLSSDQLQLMFSMRVNDHMLPGDHHSGLLAQAALNNGAKIPEGLPGWIRLVIPLDISNERRGYWLLGQRDPDDHYTSEDVDIIRALADQTTLAMINIDQAEALRALYFADIDRTEAERLHLAAELHDDVLNQLAVLSNSLNDASPASLEAYEKASFRIRNIIKGLRPAMLNYGLAPAFEAMADELNDRNNNHPCVSVEIEASLYRYNERVELSLFRIVQQACNNAIRHAESSNIYVSGYLLEDSVELKVRDDGKGFEEGNQINLARLLEHKHFGLAGMFERAALIGAELKVNSQPGNGSLFTLTWAKK